MQKHAVYCSDMLSRFEHHGLTWIDLESPTREEVQSVASEYKLDALTTQELLSPSTRPTAEFFENYIYLIMHFPALRHSHKSREQEVDFVIGRNFLITTHYDTIDPLHQFSKVFEVNSALDQNNFGDHAGFVLFFMLKKMYKALEHEVDYIKKDLSSIEEHIFSDKQVEMVAAISRSARDLLNMRQTIEPHREVLKSLEVEGAKFFGEAFTPYLRGIANDYYRVHNHIMRSTETLHELRETNNSLLTTKQNETMKIFTIMAFVTFPLALLVTILDMDSVHNPIRSLQYDFWIIIGIMLIATIVMFGYFKKKGWL